MVPNNLRKLLRLFGNSCFYCSIAQGTQASSSVTKATENRENFSRIFKFQIYLQRKEKIG